MCVCAVECVGVCARAINSLLIYEYETTTTAALSEYINVHAFFFLKTLLCFLFHRTEMDFLLRLLYALFISLVGCFVGWCLLAWCEHFVAQAAAAAQ